MESHIYPIATGLKQVNCDWSGQEILVVVIGILGYILANQQQLQRGLAFPLALQSQSVKLNWIMPYNGKPELRLSQRE